MTKLKDLYLDAVTLVDDHPHKATWLIAALIVWKVLGWIV